MSMIHKEGLLPELPNFAKIQDPTVTADKLQPTPDHMTNAALLVSSSARPAAALRDELRLVSDVGSIDATRRVGSSAAGPSRHSMLREHQLRARSPRDR